MTEIWKEAKRMKRYYKWDPSLNHVLSVCWNPNGTRICSGHDVCLCIWDLNSETWEQPLIWTTQKLNSVSWSYDGTKICCGEQKKLLSDYKKKDFIVGLRLWDETKHMKEGKKVIDSKLADLNVSSEKKNLLGNYVKDNNNVFNMYSVSWNPTSSSEFCSGGKERIYNSKKKIYEYKPRVIVWEINVNGNLVKKKSIKPDWTVHCVSWSPDGTKICACGDNGKIIIYDSRNLKPIKTIDNKGNETIIFSSVCWKFDSSQICSGSNDGIIRIWDINPENEKPLAEFDTNPAESSGESDEENKNAVKSVSWDMNSNKICSGSNDGIIRIWDVNAENNQPLAKLEGHTSAVNSVSWNPDGNKICSGSEDYTIRVWELTPDQSTSQGGFKRLKRKRKKHKKMKTKRKKIKRTNRKKVNKSKKKSKKKSNKKSKKKKNK